MEGKFEIILWLELAHVKKQIREFFRLLSLQLDIQNKVTTASQETIEPIEQPPNNPTSSTINLFNANQLDPSNDTQTLNTQLIQINTDLKISRRNLNKEFDLFIKHFNLTSTFESPFDYINQPEDIFSIVRVINYDIILPFIKLLFLNPISSHRDHKLKNSYHFLWLCLKPSWLINSFFTICASISLISNELNKDVSGVCSALIIRS